MRINEIKQLVEGTADPAFASDPNGFISAWNQAAADFFGLNAREVMGKSCSTVINGIDECGKNCSENCTIKLRAGQHQPLKSYDIQVQTKNNRQWCNISVIIVDEVKSKLPYTIHIIRPADMQKRFELFVKDFIVTETSLPTVNVNEIMSAKRTPTGVTDLTNREIEILRHLSKGETSKQIADELFISRTTVNNHIQHILRKLSAHNRLEAVRRAEQAGLI